MPRLLLHVGQPKTGSTWIQHCLRLSRDRLAEHGVVYPVRGHVETGDDAQVTPGNGTDLITSPDDLATAIDEFGTGASLAFSSEIMFHDLCGLREVAFIAEVARARGFSSVEILLFIRDPIGQAVSEWQQGIKRHGATEPLDDYLARFETPVLVANVLDALDGVEGLGVRVRNYSRRSIDLRAEVAAWLAVDRALLAEPSVERINRSLTRGETLLMQAINASAPGLTWQLTDALCEQVPEVPPDPIAPSSDAQQAAWRRLQPAVERVNARVERAHRYRFDRRKQTAGAAEFTGAQLQLLGERLGELARDDLRTVRRPWPGG